MGEAYAEEFCNLCRRSRRGITSKLYTNQLSSRTSLPSRKVFRKDEENRKTTLLNTKEKFSNILMQNGCRKK
jgi:hypothetical protein